MKRSLVIFLLCCGCSSGPTVEIDWEKEGTISESETQSIQFFYSFVEEIARSPLYERQTGLRKVVVVLSRHAGVFCCVVRVIGFESKSDSAVEIVKVEIPKAQVFKPEEGTKAALEALKFIRDKQWRQKDFKPGKVAGKPQASSFYFV